MRSKALPHRPSLAIVAWRTAHAVVTLGFLAAIAEIWRAALSGRESRFLRPAVAALLAEGVVVGANGGDCPLGPLGDQIGDEVPLFELVLPPRAAKAAVPVLGTVAGVGMVTLLVRRRLGFG